MMFRRGRFKLQVIGLGVFAYAIAILLVVITRDGEH